MSTPTALSIQLATLSQNNYGTNNGGHGKATAASSSRRRLLPSILHDNAREASSTSLVTLRENAMVAFDSLWREVAILQPTSNNDDMADYDIGDCNLLANPRKLLSTTNLDHYERGTATIAENEIMDGYIEEMLSYLMTCLVEYPGNSCSSSNILTTTSCLHIIEYLLRKYEIHNRTNSASLLLQTVLPYHIIVMSHGDGGEEDTNRTAHLLVFSRILTLVHDLLQGGNLPQWSFLLPYASSASGRGGGGGSPIMFNRTKLAKFVSKDDAITKVIANIGKKAMEIGSAEDQWRRKIHGGRGETRRGISALISFSASILTEAISIQLSNKDANLGGGGDKIVGGVRESYVRALFPMVLSACKSGSGSSNENKGGGNQSRDDDGSNYHYYCSEWKEWGRILASTLALSCPFLGMNVKIALCDAIIDGLLPSHRCPTSFEGRGDVDDVTLSSKSADDACSAIMTLLSILSTMNAWNENDTCDAVDDNNWRYYLPMLPPRRNRGTISTSAATIIDYLGCELPVSTYKRMSKKASVVSMAMGSVLNSLCEQLNEESDVVMEEEDNSIVIMERLTPLLASIIMHAFIRLEKEAKKWLSSNVVSPRKINNLSVSEAAGEADEGFKADRDVQFICSLVRDIFSRWHFSQIRLYCPLS